MLMCDRKLRNAKFAISSGHCASGRQCRRAMAAVCAVQHKLTMICFGCTAHRKLPSFHAFESKLICCLLTCLKCCTVLCACVCACVSELNKYIYYLKAHTPTHDAWHMQRNGEYCTRSLSSIFDPSICLLSMPVAFQVCLPK